MEEEFVLKEQKRQEFKIDALQRIADSLESINANLSLLNQILFSASGGRPASESKSKES